MSPHTLLFLDILLLFCVDLFVIVFSNNGYLYTIRVDTLAAFKNVIIFLLVLDFDIVFKNVFKIFTILVFVEEKKKH